VDPEVLRTLYGGPPTGFVAARDALAKELRARGEREAAAEVKRLRRHDPVEWTLNRAAHLHPDLVGSFVQAAGDLRDAQAAAVEGRAGGDVRGAAMAVRERQAALVDAARRLEHAPPAADLAARLLELAPDEAATTQLREGVLGASELAPAELFAGLTPARRSQPARARSARRGAAREEGRGDEPPRDDPGDGEDGAAERAPNRSAQRREARERVRAARTAERDAQAAVRSAQRRRDAARGVADEARERLARAERDLAGAERELDAAKVDLDAASAATAEAERAADQV
jgi:hypothetical protein